MWHKIEIMVVNGVRRVGITTQNIGGKFEPQVPVSISNLEKKWAIRNNMNALWINHSMTKFEKLESKASKHGKHDNNATNDENDSAW